MKIQQDVLAVLDCADVEGNHLKLTGQLDRKLYTAVNKVLEGIGGKWNRKAGAHVFEEDVAEMLEQIIATGEYRRVKQDLGQFDTPADVAKTVVDFAQIRLGNHILEPSAGKGSLARLAALAAGTYVDCVEIDEKRAKHLTIVPGVARITHRDFMTVVPVEAESYDRVVMNPPLARQADIEHVTHALKFLKPDGCLTAVMSQSVRWRHNEKAVAFRTMLKNMSAVWFDLPTGAFAESGTMVNACVVRVWKDGRTQ